MASTTGLTQQICHNCETVNTPLWRRDGEGLVLCNACGLFLKLHGRARPLSLKSDVIKSRNRVKGPKSENHKQLNAYHSPGFGLSHDPNHVSLAAQAADAQLLILHQQPTNGHMDDSGTGVGRTGTPNLYQDLQPFADMDDRFQTVTLPAFALSGASPDGSTSPLHGDLHLSGADGSGRVTATNEQLLAHTSSLKTRVSELEVINELFRGRLSQLEQDEALLRDQLAAATKAEVTLAAQLQDSHRRENNLKRRLDELELELQQTKDTAATAAKRHATAAVSTPRSP